MERFIDVPGGRLFVIDDGDGPPLVLLHAGIADHRAWDAMIPGLTRAGYRAVRYDIRGFGRSTTTDVEFSNRADVVAVLDALAIDRVVLVGNSRGGQIAFDMAIEFPDRVVAVVGVAAGLGGFEADVTPAEMALFDEMDRLESAQPPDPDAIADFDVQVWVDGPGQPSTRVPAAIRDAVRMMDRPQYVAGHVDGRPIVLTPSASERLAELTTPVLALAGALDVSEVAHTARHLAANAPAARVVILPDVAHMIGMELPDRLNELIVEFVRPLETWS
jgi:pimeloyl-ACP methyl ester carboxylesterase